MGDLRKAKYYSDGITKITDPFWVVKCFTCGYEGWNLIHTDSCTECGSEDISCTNAAIKNNPSS
jgi:hypothetical protein